MEKLKLLYNSETDIPKEYASLYEEVDSKFKLTGIDGIKTQADVDKVMDAKKHEVDNRKTIEQELAELKKNYEGIDTSKYKELLADHEKAAMLKIDPKADLDKIKLQKDLDDLKATLETANASISALEREKKQVKIDKATLAECRKLKLDPRFDEDVLLRTSSLDISDSDIVMTKDGLSLAEFLQPLATRFGLPSNGTGATTPTGSLNAQTDRATAYAEAKKTGDTRGMMLHAPETK